MKEFNVSKGDVLDVANRLKMPTPTDEEVMKILNAYPEWQAGDPTGTWDLVIEELLYEKDNLDD